MPAQRANQIECNDGIELDEKAASQATENAQESQWHSFIHIHQ